MPLYPPTTSSGSGDVVGPASSTDTALVRFDATTGKLIQDSGVIVDDSNNIKIPGVIQDANGATVLDLQEGSTPANYIGIKNAPSAQEAQILALGSGSNAGMLLLSKGTGSILLRNGTNGTNAVRLERSDGGAILRVDTTNGFVGINGVNTAPHTTLHSHGAFATAYAAKTSNYTVTATDSKLSGDCTSGTLTFTLPAAASIAGREYHFKRIDASGNSVVIDANASETIDGATTKTLGSQWAQLSIYSNGTNWYILSQMGTIT